ncbi:MAG: gamma-glutamylcyclotransferase [Deltaproteobacteria bacterium]|nr:gamma-glutamylcyclotransferase [Deltaproteobacteria bacterium]
MLYFAYGSNMDWEQMKRRCPSVKFISVARLKDYRFAIARTSYSRGCGSAGVIPEPGACAWGVVYDIEEKDFGALDAAEDYAPGREKNSYTRREGTVYADGAEGKNFLVELYFPETEQNPPLPNPEYKRLIVGGATQWGLPQDYIRELEELKVAVAGQRC